MADLEDSLKTLDRLTQEEARIALSEVLRIANNIRDEVEVVDSKLKIVGDKVVDVGTKVSDVGDKVEDVGDKVDDVGDKLVDVGDKVEDLGDKVEDIGDNVHCVLEKLQVVIDRARGLSPHSLIPSNIFAFRGQASRRRGEGNEIDCSTDGNCHRRRQVFVIP